MYNTDAFAQKTQNDILFFGELFKKFALEESEFNVLRDHLKETYILAKELYEECNIQPLASHTKLRSKAILQNLSENDIVYHQYKKFSKDLNKDFITPLTEGSINTIYENESTKIVNAILSTDNSLDPEIAKSYAIFESVLGDVLKDFIIPKDNIIGMVKYASNQRPEYFNVFERNIKQIKDELNETLKNLTCCLAVNMFKSGIQFAKEFNKDDYKFEDYKGISKLLDSKDDDLDQILDTKTSEAEKLKKEDEESLTEKDHIDLDVENILDKNENDEK